MIVKIIERCRYENEEYGNKFEYGVRVIEYETKAESIDEAIKEIETDFDFDNVINCWDSFDGECLDSEVLKYEVAE